MKKFNKQEAGDYLGIVTGTIDRWMREGEISYNKIGSKVFFTQEDLDAKIVSYPVENKPTTEKVIEVLEKKNHNFTKEELDIAKKIIAHLFKGL
jgi:excisionase family DNA binding protein